jgi:ferritin-like metal-binding protein YciE
MTLISDPRALFLHELGDILGAERTIEKMLGKLQADVRDKDLARGLERHRDQTRQHVANLEEAFRTLGEQPKAERCPGIEGIRTEYDESAHQVAPELRDVFTGGAVARTEHYEMAVYRGLVTTAKALGERDAARLLEKNLKEDEQMAKEIESLAERLVADRAKETAGARRSAASEGLDDLTVDELQARAREAGIEGRSKMSKRELVRALRGTGR